MAPSCPRMALANHRSLCYTLASTGGELGQTRKREQSMQRRFLALGILVISVLLMGGLVSATTAQPEELELVKVEGQSDGDLLQVESFPVQVYARLTGDDRPYLLVGAPPGTVETLRERGFDAAVLDGDLREANYYLAYFWFGVF
jgi:hypothetical protein